MIKKILLVSAGLIVLTITGFLIWVASYPELRKSKTVGGLPRMQSQYLTMRDGVRIAVDIWLPPDMGTDDRVPTLVAGTRYSRGYSFAQKLDFKTKMKIRLENIDERRVEMVELTPEAAWANDAGYAVVIIDARGSAASFGSRDIEWSPDEVADYGEIIAWIAEQSWSNGKIGAWGTSYPGNTAELMASTGQPAFLATAPRFSDFDPLLGVGMPGGLKADGFIQQWSALNAALDHNPAASRAVDSDRSGELLEEAIAGHNDLTIAEALSAIEYRDDEYGQSRLTMEAASPYSLRESIEAGNTPMQFWVSWLDAGTADGALSRYLTFSNPQQVLIGPWNHGGSASIDPFLYEYVIEDNTETMLAGFEIIKPQMEQVLAFFDLSLIHI